MHVMNSESLRVDFLDAVVVHAALTDPELSEPWRVNPPGELVLCRLGRFASQHIARGNTSFASLQVDSLSGNLRSPKGYACFR